MDGQKPLSEKELENLRLHVAGATIRHKSPFSHLPMPVKEAPLSGEMTEKWVVPFYMREFGDPSPHSSPRFSRINAQSPDFIKACVEATPEITLSLLAEFNWRPRVVAARFVAVRRFFDLQEVVSVLLVRSDVCYAGIDYCLALASLGNESAAETLSTYLGYYLTRPDLGYNQWHAMAALLYLDEVLGASRAQQLIPLWESYIGDKSRADLEFFNRSLRKSLSIIGDIQQAVDIQGQEQTASP